MFLNEYDVFLTDTLNVSKQYEKESGQSANVDESRNEVIFFSFLVLKWIICCLTELIGLEDFYLALEWFNEPISPHCYALSLLCEYFHRQRSDWVKLLLPSLINLGFTKTGNE